MSESNGDAVSVSWIRLQIGLMREIVSLERDTPEPSSMSNSLTTSTGNGIVAADRGVLTTIRDAAVSLVGRKFSDLQVSTGLRDRDSLLLFIHNQSNPNILELVTSPNQLIEGALVEVVLSAMASMDEECSRPHNLAIHNYKSPAFCDLCGEMLWGLFKQGLKCDACGMNFHKRCVYKVKNDCSNQRDRRKSSLEDVTPGIMTSPSVQAGTGQPRRAYSTVASSTSPLNLTPPPNKYATLPSSRGIQVEHTFVCHSMTRPTVCQYCHKLLALFRQALQCKDCKFNCHKKCAEFVPKNCQGEMATANNQEDSEPDTDMSDVMGPILANTLPAVSEERNDDDDGADTVPSDSTANIPLMRVVQSVKHTKRTGNNVIREGWMVHCTNKDNKTSKRHFWRLDTKSITMFTAKDSSRYYKEIQLSDITNVTQAVTDSGSTRPRHVFEIHTADTIYFVGEDTESGVEENGSGKESARWMETAIRQALLPVTPKGSAENQPASTKLTEVKVVVEPDNKKDINQLYEVFPDDVLGSGQFGIVYGGIHRASGRDVAIKVIDKLRFPNKDKDTLKNEVSILKNLHHPGVVNLEDMFETPSKIYVIMEKLKGDMLEMILSSPKGRLNERITRFLISQILKALQYLHAKPRSIVHCDLKPENVLLSTGGPYPQVKLCDFGFARIIGEKSFRRSLVGTPAYLAPEVLKDKCYNRSLDMWSVGVILYVSLSGTFPFNEDEDITDQIQNAAFMYPPTPWKEVSRDAVDLISKLLQVKLGCRYTADQSLEHGWLQNYKCWCDLRKLEAQVGERYLTHEFDDPKWDKYRDECRLEHWSELGQKGTA